MPNNTSLSLATLLAVAVSMGVVAEAGAAQVCNPSFAGKLVILRDVKANRALQAEQSDPQHAGASSYTGQKWQQWRVQSAGSCSYYLVDAQHGQALVATDNGKKEPIFHEAHQNRANARWTFDDAGNGQWWIIEQKDQRRLLAADDNGVRKLFSYNESDARSRTNARWTVEVVPEPVCDPPVAGLMTLKEAKADRYLSAAALDPARPVARSYGGNSYENWRMEPAPGCSFYLRDDKYGQAVLAGDDTGNNQTFHEADGGRENARWRLYDAGDGLWNLIDVKGGRALMAADDVGVDAVFAEPNYARDNARWQIAAPTGAQCKDSFLALFDDPNKRRYAELHYTNPKKSEGFLPVYGEQFGHRTEHTQASLRLPNHGGKAYFMFTSSQDYAGYLWVVEIDGTSWTGTRDRAGRVVWFEKYGNNCNSHDHCMGDSNEGNFNHPARMALIDGQPIVAVALQNWTGRGDRPVRPEPRGSDSVAFYDISNPAAPVFMYKMVGRVGAHWSGQAPGNDISKVAMGPQGGQYFLMVGDNDKFHYTLPASGFDRSRRSVLPATRNTGRWKAGTYTRGDDALIDVGVGAAGRQITLSRRIVDAQNNRTGSCTYGAHQIPGNWQKDACDIANGFTHRDGRFSVICHHQKPEQHKFLVIDTGP